MGTGTSPTLSRVVHLALGYLGFGAGKRKQVTEESVDAVLGNGDIHAAGANLRTSGDVRGVKAGARVPVLWNRANLAPGEHGVKPAVVLSHQRRQGAPPSPLRPPAQLVVAGAVEELFIALDATGQLDVWFRNDTLCAPLNVRGALAARGPLTHAAFAGVNLNAELTRVRWGTKADRFHLELGGPPGAYFAVFELSRTMLPSGIFRRLKILPAVTLRRIEPVGVAEFDLGAVDFEHRLSGTRQKWTVKTDLDGIPVIDSVEPMDGAYTLRSSIRVVLGPGAFYRQGDGVTMPPQHFGDASQFRYGHLTAYIASAVVDDAWKLAVTIWFAFNHIETHRGGPFMCRAQLRAEGTGGAWPSAVARYYRVEALDATGATLSVSSEASVFRLCPDGGTNTLTFGVPPYAITRTVQIKWDRVPHATAYRIWRSEIPNVYSGALLATVAALEGADPTFGLLMQGYIDTGAATGIGDLVTGLDPGGLLPHPLGTHYWLGSVAQNFMTSPGSKDQLGLPNDAGLIGTTALACTNTTQCRWKPGIRVTPSDPLFRTASADDPDVYFGCYNAQSVSFLAFDLLESHTAMLLVDTAGLPAPGWSLLWGSYDFAAGLLIDYASDLWFTRPQESDNFSGPTLTAVWTVSPAPSGGVNDRTTTPAQQLTFEGLPGAVCWKRSDGLGGLLAPVNVVPSWRYAAGTFPGSPIVDLGHVGTGGAFSFLFGYHNGIRATMRADLFPTAPLPFLPSRTDQYFSASRERPVEVQAWTLGASSSGFLAAYTATWLHTFKQHNNFVSAIPLRWSGTTATLLLVNVEVFPAFGNALAGQPTRLRQSGLFLYNPQTQEMHAIKPLADYGRFVSQPAEWPLHEPIYYPLQWTADFVVWADLRLGGTYVTHLPAVGAVLATATTVQVAAAADAPTAWDLSDVIVLPEIDSTTLAFKASDTQASFLRLGKLGTVQSLYDRREVGRHFLDWLSSGEPRAGFQDEAVFPKRASRAEPELPAVLRGLPASVLDADGNPVIAWSSYAVRDLAPST